MPEIKMTAREWLRKNMSKYSSEREAGMACSKELKLGYHSVMDKARLLRSEITLAKVSKETVGLSTEDLRQKYDAFYKIKEAIKEIPKGRFIPEAEFREIFVRCESTKFRAKADLEEFNKCKGRARGVTYWGNPEDIKNLKEQGVLS